MCLRVMIMKTILPLILAATVCAAPTGHAAEVVCGTDPAKVVLSALKVESEMEGMAVGDLPSIVQDEVQSALAYAGTCLLYTSPSPRDS